MENLAGNTFSPGRFPEFLFAFLARELRIGNGRTKMANCHLPVAASVMFDTRSIWAILNGNDLVTAVDRPLTCCYPARMDVNWTLNTMRRKLVTSRRGLRKADVLSKVDREMASSNTREILRLLNELEGMLS